jgi:hypothetical protein
MLAIYHKIFRSTCILSATGRTRPGELVEQARISSAITTSADVASGGSPEPAWAIVVNRTYLRAADTIVIWDVRAVMSLHFFLFICSFHSVEDGPGGIYLSGQSSNPANRRPLRIDPSVGFGQSFSGFRTRCVG